jgi:hypothetical protein
MRKLTPEGMVRCQIGKYLRDNGWFIFNVMQGGQLSHKGVSNIIGIKCGIVAFVKVTSERGCIDEMQKRFQDDVESRGGHYFILRSVEDAEAMERKLDLKVAG